MNKPQGFSLNENEKKEIAQAIENKKAELSRAGVSTTGFTKAATALSEHKGAESGRAGVPEHLFTSQPQKFSKTPAPLMYECPDCGQSPLPIRIGNGYVRRPCKCEEEAREAAQKQEITTDRKDTRAQVYNQQTYTWTGSNHYQSLATKTLEQFEQKYQLPALRSVATYTRTVTAGKKPKEPFANVIFIGPAGTGKTHLAAAMINRFAEQGYGVLFCTGQQLFKALYGAEFAKKNALFDLAASCDFLLVDDIAKIHVSARDEDTMSFQQGELLDLMDRRYAAGLPTILTCNESDLSRWLVNPCQDRLEENMIKILTSGKSYRQIIAERRAQANQ